MTNPPREPLPGPTPLPESLARRAPLPIGTEEKASAGGAALRCTLLGLALAFGGIYFLVIAPGMPVADAQPDSLGALRVVNFQRLAIGQALFVAGCVFLAAAWRPR